MNFNPEGFCLCSQATALWGFPRQLIDRQQPLILSEAFPDSRVLKFAKELDYLIFAFIKPKNKSKMHLKPKFIQITEY